MTVGWLKQKHGPFYLWEKPKKDSEYVIGADVAEGKAVTDDPQAGSAGRDWSAACVLEKRTGDLVAGFLDQLPSNEYAEELFSLGTWYNDAMLAVEVNSVGVSTVHALNAAEYPNMYTPESMKSPHWHDYSGLKGLGWVTSRTTKPVLIDAIREALVGGLKIPWDKLLGQLESMELDPKSGNPSAPYGMHDDIVMAYGIGLCVRKELLEVGKEKVDEYDSRLSADTRRIYRALAKMIEREKEIDD